MSFPGKFEYSLSSTALATADVLPDKLPMLPLTLLAASVSRREDDFLALRLLAV